MSRGLFVAAAALWLPFASISAQPPAQGSSWSVLVDSIGVSIETRNVWRGFVRGSTTLRSALHVAFWGFPITTEGERGLVFDAAGWTVLADRDQRRSADRYIATLAFLQRLSRGTETETSVEPEAEPAILSLGVSTHLLPDSPSDARSTYEVVASIYGPRLPKWPRERRPRFYIDLARDLDETSETFVRGGLVLDYSLPFLKPKDKPLSLFFDLSGSASDYPCAAGACASMSLHAWRALARFVWDSPEGSFLGLDGNLRLALMGGGLWPRARIGPNVGYGGIQLALAF